MKVQIKLDPACPEPVLTIRAAQLTPQLQALAQRLESEEEGRLLGWQGERVTVLTAHPSPGSTPRTGVSSARIPPGRPTPCACGSTSWRSSWTPAGLCASPTRSL